MTNEERRDQLLAELDDEIERGLDPILGMFLATCISLIIWIALAALWLKLTGRW
jgi:hypothetical protein